MSFFINPDMIMKSEVFEKGLSKGDIPLEDISEVIKRDDTFVWLGLRQANPELLLKIQEEFGLHELAIEDAGAAHQRPKIEEYGDSLFIVLQTAELIQGEVQFGEVHIFFGPKFLITIRHGSSKGFEKVRNRCRAKPQQLARGPAFALYAVMDFVVDNYMPVVNGLQAQFEIIESAIFADRPNRKTMEALYELKRELLLLEDTITPVIDICNELLRFHQSLIHKEVRFYFRDISDHIKRIDRAIDGMREMLLAAMQVHLTFETVRQNEVVKRLAGWGAILAIPTMVFSLYGMNFKHMPELDWEYSYPVIVGAVTIGSLLLYWRLKRAGWL